LENALEQIGIIVAIADHVSSAELKSLLRKQPDMNVLDFEGDNGINLLLAVQEFNPAVVILSLLEDDSEPGICSHLLEEFSDLTVIAISRSKIRRLSRACVMSFSAAALLETIRTATEFTKWYERGS
jgi:DNA-binding NarL/FixJ family response regulator